MTPKPTTRQLVCLLLVLCLCGPMLPFAAPVADRDRAPEFRAVAAPAPSVLLLMRAGRPNEHAHQRPSAPSLFNVVALQGGGSDPGGLVEALEHRIPRSLWADGPQTGRSPPAISYPRGL